MTFKATSFGKKKFTITYNFTFAGFQRAQELSTESSANHRTVTPEEHSHVVGGGIESAQAVVAHFPQRSGINIRPVVHFNVVAGAAVVQSVKKMKSNNSFFLV